MSLPLFSLSRSLLSKQPFAAFVRRAKAAALVCAVCVAAVQSAAAENATVLVNDTFADGDRSTDSLTAGTGPCASIPWHASVNKWVKTDATGMTVTTDNGSATIWGFFAPAGSPIALKPGESLRLRFDFTYSKDVAEYVDFRFGMFSFGNDPRPEEKKFSSKDLKGYFVVTRTQGAKADGSTLYAQNNGGKEVETFNNKEATNTVVGAKFPALDAKEATHTATMTIKCVSTDAVEITTSFDAGDAGSTQTDNVLKQTSFDSAAIYLGRLKDTTVRLTNFKVELVRP